MTAALALPLLPLLHDTVWCTPFRGRCVCACLSSEFDKKKKDVVRACADHANLEPNITIDHVGSADSLKKVREFLVGRDSVVPPYLFGEVSSLQDTNAFCFKTGGAVGVPNADLCFAGFVCDDFSSNNNKNMQYKNSIFDEVGKSAHTFLDMLDALDSTKTIILMAENVTCLVSVRFACCLQSVALYVRSCCPSPSHEIQHLTYLAWLNCF